MSEIKKAPMFAVIADEVEDSAHVEQRPVAVRFVDSNRKIREEFLGYTRLPERLSGTKLPLVFFLLSEN